ncbi:acyl-CoA mutase large subunit family protein [Fluviispira sanaruensis]|uniref:Methylmalonyl-CoA mutase n=1 Tax=Fluviispira sanaruensis TaxID=2493639 RepID=A0A4P2VXU4_FLUSA|nr:methylmalonyl-CoA mutase family protein [Fluviispira sanaruensis]BBH54465.1 methylmalonyl-CoA mutase [Fluviispira sanaruensis]
MSSTKSDLKRKKEFVTASRSVVDELYFPSNAMTDSEYLSKINFPGEFPFTRGVHSGMYRSSLWTMRQYAGFASAEESNKRYKYLLAQGQTGLSVAFDLPTQIGYDSDSDEAAGEVGKVGVAIDTLADMEILFNGIPLDKISTSMTINSSAAVLLALYIAVAEKQGISSLKLRGTIQNDILKEYIARGTYIFPPQPSMRIITDIFAFCKEHVPLWNTISISGYHIREAGSTASEEVGFTLADGIAYVEAAVKVGLNVDEFAPRLSFFFNSYTDLLEEVGKFRAARRVWAKIMKERFGAQNPKSLMLRFHTQTAGSTLTAQQPENNIVRVTIQALAAVLGGTQSLHTNSKDEALALPTEESARIALRTQQIIAHESGVAETVDPLAGSYYIEAITDRIENEVVDIIKKIDSLGGMVQAIEQGYVQASIQKSAYQYQQDIESLERVIVGVNKFVVEEKQLEGLLRVEETVEKIQIESLKKIKRKRDTLAVTEALIKLKGAAQGTDNLMPHILSAVRAYASIGEICNTLREVFGEYKESVIL